MAHGGGREPLGQVRRRPFDAVRRHPDQQAGRALQRHMTSLRERKSLRLWSNSGLPSGGLFCMNDGQAPSHPRAKARVVMTGPIFYEPVERDRKKRIEWSRITTVYRETS